MIVYQSKNIDKIGARIEWARFTVGGVEEVHAMLHVEPRCELLFVVQHGLSRWNVWR